MDIQKIIENLVGIEYDKNDTKEFENEVIMAFESDEEVIVSKDECNSNIDFQAYENRVNAPIICIKIEDGCISEAWRGL